MNKYINKNINIFKFINEILPYCSWILLGIMIYYYLELFYIIY